VGGAILVVGILVLSSCSVESVALLMTLRGCYSSEDGRKGERKS